MSTLLSIAAFPAKAWLDKYNIETQTRSLYTDLMNARASAMQKKRAYFVILTTSQYTIYEDIDPTAANPDKEAVDGDDTFEEADKLVMQKTTQYPIVTLPTGTGFSFDREGLSSLTGTMHFDLTNSSAESAYDCVTLSTTRILMGKWSGSGCDSK